MSINGFLVYSLLLIDEILLVIGDIGKEGGGVVLTPLLNGCLKTSLLNQMLNWSEKNMSFLSIKISRTYNVFS